MRHSAWNTVWRFGSTLSQFSGSLPRSCHHSAVLKPERDGRSDDIDVRFISRTVLLILLLLGAQLGRFAVGGADEPQERPHSDDLKRLWTDLAGDDAARAYRA